MPGGVTRLPLMQLVIKPLKFILVILNALQLFLCHREKFVYSFMVHASKPTMDPKAVRE